MSESAGTAFHRLAGKLALSAAAACLVGVGIVAGITSLTPLAWALPFVVGIATYVASVRILGTRVELARSVLRQIRKHRFENLEAVHVPRGDELNDLIWQVYRTGQVLEHEMQDLRRTESYRKEFLGNVSHELKTPIFAIRGFAETLLGGAMEDPAVNRTFLDRIMRNADRLGILAQDLSEISRIESGELKMNMVPFDLEDLVAEVVESLEPAANAKQVVLHNALSSHLPPVLGDANHLRQVLVNLVDNGIKYNNPGGQVEIVARALPGKRIKISVVDNGIGISEEHLPRITERFYRVDRSRSRSQGGTGLGLAIVKHILAAHDTALRVESVPGGGSTFGFSMPGA